jgi:hypothetical protein
VQAELESDASLLKIDPSLANAEVVEDMDWFFSSCYYNNK